MEFGGDASTYPNSIFEFNFNPHHESKVYYWQQCNAVALPKRGCTIDRERYQGRYGNERVSYQVDSKSIFFMQESLADVSQNLKRLLSPVKVPEKAVNVEQAPMDISSDTRENIHCDPLILDSIQESCYESMESPLNSVFQTNQIPISQVSLAWSHCDAMKSAFDPLEYHQNIEGHFNEDNLDEDILLSSLFPPLSIKCDYNSVKVHQNRLHRVVHARLAPQRYLRQARKKLRRILQEIHIADEVGVRMKKQRRLKALEGLD
jgi:hypothetical protein